MTQNAEMIYGQIYAAINTKFKEDIPSVDDIEAEAIKIKELFAPIYPISDEEFPYITMISDVYNYHMRKFYNEFTVILDRLVTFVKYTSICVTNIVKEGDTTVFYIDLPKPTEDSIKYMLLQYSLDIKTWFEETFLRFKREMFVTRYGYRLLDKTNFKVKAIVTSFSEEDEEKRKELNKAYTTYLFTLANNTIGYKYYKGEEE